MFPLRARSGGVIERAGQTEAAVDLARIAGRGIKRRRGVIIVAEVRPTHLHRDHRVIGRDQDRGIRGRDSAREIVIRRKRRGRGGHFRE